MPLRSKKIAQRRRHTPAYVQGDARCGPVDGDESTVPAGRSACPQKMGRCIKAQELNAFPHRVPSPSTPTTASVSIPPSQRAGRVTSGTPGPSTQPLTHPATRTSRPPLRPAKSFTMSTESLYYTSVNAALPHLLSRIAIPINPTSILLAIISFFLGVAVYRLYFSPLAAIPGPWFAAVSDLWLNVQIARLEQHRTIQALFERYGPVVRIGPNKVAFCDVTTARSVYAIHKFDKSNLYKSLLTYVRLLPYQYLAH